MQEKQKTQPYLVAYLQLRPLVFFSLEDLYSHLQTYLPTSMLPSAIEVLDELPLTPNKKIDRKSLPPVDIPSSDRRVEYVAPTTKLEQQLAQIWQEVLGIEKVGIYDNFFSLGGDSMSIFQMLDRALDKGIYLQLKHLIYAQTIAEISELL